MKSKRESTKNHPIEKVGKAYPEFDVRLGTGVIALQQAMNDTVERYHWIIIGMVNIAVLFLATFAYGSVVAAFILIIPVNLANLMLVATMHLVGVGLDINAGIVAVIGVGVGN